MFSKQLAVTCVAGLVALVVAMSAVPASAAPGGGAVLTKVATVGLNGTGVALAQFDGSPRPGVRYTLTVENGCRACAPSVGAIAVTLNDRVVFQRVAAGAFGVQSVPVAVEAQDNRIVIAVTGVPGSAARVRILAIPAAAERTSFRAKVRVGSDGSEALAGQFDAFSRLRYVLEIENGCRPDDRSRRRCPPPLAALTITLNDRVVFQGDDVGRHRETLPAGLLTSEESNRIVVAAQGLPGSAARVRIVAVPARAGRRANAGARSAFLALQEATQMESRHFGDTPGLSGGDMVASTRP